MRMLAYFLRLAIRLMPAAIILALPFIVFWRLREFVPPGAIVEEAARGANVLVGQGYWPMPADQYVNLSIARKKPAVMTLGNSRVLEFRAPFFKDGNFFNAGGTVGSASGFKRMLEGMPDGYKPKVVILGLEQSFFIERPAEAPVVGAGGKPEPIPTYMALLGTVYQDFFRGKISPAKVWAGPDQEYRAFGVNAVMNQNGLRRDGSYHYGRRVSHPDEAFEDSGFRDTFWRMDSGCCRFEPSSDIGQRPLADLADLLDYCARNGIYAVGFIPSYPSPVLEKMRASGKYGYLDKLEPALKPLFDGQKFPLFNFSDLKSTGAADGEYIDGLHASEKAYLRMWIKMAESDKVLAGYADLAELKRRLEQTKGDFEVFGPAE